MAFPSIGSSTSNGTAASTTHAVSLPASIAAGDLLIAAVRVGNGAPYTWPAGWNPIVDVGALGIAWRAADGSEGASVSVTSSTSNSGACSSYRITGADTTAGAEATAGTSTSTTNPDPPSLAPSWGSADVLWFAYTTRSNTTVPTSFPTNYSLGQISQNNSAGNTSLHSCARQLTASSEDPGTFSFSTSSASLPATVAVKGAGAAPFIPRDFSLPRKPASTTGHINSLALNLFGKDQFFGAPGQGPRYDYPNPKAPARSIELRTWINAVIPPAPTSPTTPDQVAITQNPPRAIRLPGYVNTAFPPSIPPAPRGTVPFIQAAIPQLAPRLRQVQVQDRPVNLSLYAMPGIPIQWDLPVQAKRSQGFTGSNLLETTLAVTAVPFTALEWRVPGPKVRGDSSWTVNLLLTTLAVGSSHTHFRPRVGASGIQANATGTGAKARVKGAGTSASTIAPSSRARTKSSATKAKTTVE